jgi:hypothetical protein
MAGSGECDSRSGAISRRGALIASALALALSGRARAETSPVRHVVLLGDTVFDNAAYVGGTPDVRRQLAAILPKDFQATLLARDGAVMADVAAQLAQLPRDATHLVVSAGGNDALRESGVLDERARSVAEAMNRLAAVAERFGRDYSALLDALARRKLPAAVCTIYEPRFPEADRRRVAAAALTLLNDRITRQAFTRGLSLLDLRIICNEDADFANPIEPSARGGEKIARAISAFTTGSAPAAGVFTG